MNNAPNYDPYRAAMNRLHERTKDESRIANEIQAENPDISRTEALRAAKRFLDKVESK